MDPEVILQQQKDEIIRQIKEYCNNPTRKSIWKSLKDSSGFQGKIEEMPIELLKELHKKLTAD